MSDHAGFGPSAWVTGSPWQDIRLHASLNPGEGKLVSDIPGTRVLRRPCRWMLTEEGWGSILVPVPRSGGEPFPLGSDRLKISMLWLGGEPWACVACTEAELEDVFLQFSGKLLASLGQGISPLQAIRATLEQYRTLFLAPSATVSSEKIIGLLGELLVLEYLLDNKVDAVRAWRGPYREAHDFQLPGVHVEVKTCSAAGEKKARISSLHQLEEPSGASLYLVLLRMVPGGSQTVEAVSRRILERLGEEDSRNFRAALRKEDCRDPEDPAWNACGISDQSLEAWLVKEGFPRLVPGMLPDCHAPSGVRDISYTISFDHASDFAVSLDDLLQSIRDAGANDS